MYRRSALILGLVVIVATSIWYSLLRAPEQMEPRAKHGVVTEDATSPSPVSPGGVSIELEEDSAQSELGTSPESHAFEIIQEIDQSNLEEKNSSWDSGFEKISTIDPQRILRWRPVRVNPKTSIAIDAHGSIEPRDILSLSIFPGETIVARKTRFRNTPEASTMSWTGLLENGEIGTVSIHVGPEQDANDLRAIIHYSSKYQDFHVVPTADSRFYVAVETNRDAKMTID